MTAPHRPVRPPASGPPPGAAPDTTSHAAPAAGPVPVLVNGDPCDLAPGTTLDALVAARTSAPSGVAAAVNETVVPRHAWRGTGLRAGDRVEILTAVQGG